MANKKYSILTYIFGNYEFVREPLEIDEDCEYILVTDNISLKSKTWKIIYLQDVKLTNSFDKSLYVRYHPFEFAKTETVFVLDSSIQIKKSLNEIYHKFVNSNCDILLNTNCFNTTLLQDLYYWKNYQTKSYNFSPNNLDKLENLIKYLHYESLHCVEINFRVIKNNKLNNELNEYVWEYLNFLKNDKVLPRNDQIVFTIVFNKYFRNMKTVVVTRQIIQSKYLQYCKHNSNTPIITNINFNKLYFLDKPIKAEIYE